MNIFTRLIGAITGRTAQGMSRWIERVAAGRSDRPTQEYNQVVPVRVCVQYIRRSCSNVPLRISTPDDQVIEQGPLAQLALRPNGDQSAGQFIADTISCYLLFGRYHHRITGNSALELQVENINPLQMEAIQEDGRLAAWWYSPVAGERIRLELDEVHTVVDPDYHNPQNTWDGVSARNAAGMAISQYYKADLANESSLDNDVQPAGAVSTDQNLSAEQERLLRAGIRSEHAGSRNRRKIMLLQGGLKWQQMAANFKDMEFLEGRAFSREDICAAFGLKAIMFYSQGGSGLNDDQSRSAKVDAHVSVIRPLLKMVGDEFSCTVLARLKLDRTLTLRDGLRREWRRSAVSAGQARTKAYRSARAVAMAGDLPAFAWFDDTGEAVTAELWQSQADSSKTYFEIGVPLNDILAATDAPFPERPHGNVPRIPMGMVDARETGAGEPGYDDPAETDPVDPDAELIEDDDADTPTKKRSADMPRGLTDEQLKAIWLRLRSQVEGVQRQFVGPYKRHAMELRGEVLSNLKRLDPGRPEIDRSADVKRVAIYFTDDQGLSRRTVVSLSTQQRDILGEILFDLRRAVDGRWKVVSKYIELGLKTGGDESMREAAAAFGQDAPEPFNLKDPESIAAMRRRRIAIGTLTSNQRERLRAALAKAMSEGKTTAEMTEIVRKRFNIEGGEKRARLIAFQESSSAVEEGRQIGRVQAGVPGKSWLGSRKETSRPEHAETERVTMATPIPTDQDFIIAGTGITCPHPRASGVAAQDIFCACTTISRYPGDQVRDRAAIRAAAGITNRKEQPHA